MLVNKLPMHLFPQHEIAVRHLEAHNQVFTIANSFAHCCYKLAWLRKMLEYMAADNQIRWLTHIVFRVIIRYEPNIGWNVISRLGLIARTETDANIVPAIAYDAQKLPPSASDFDNLFLMQVIFGDQLV